MNIFLNFKSLISLDCSCSGSIETIILLLGTLKDQHKILNAFSKKASQILRLFIRFIWSSFLSFFSDCWASEPLSLMRFPLCTGMTPTSDISGGLTPVSSSGGSISGGITPEIKKEEEDSLPALPDTSPSLGTHTISAAAETTMDPQGEIN